jgi:hypothetical protein
MFLVSKEQGKSVMKEIVERYSFVEKNPDLIKKRLLSEQDMTTKFVLPMLQALYWDPLKIMRDGPEIHEKGFRERDIEASAQEKARRGGLPDFSLCGKYSKVPFFVEVKHPSKKLNLEKHLRKYKDGHVVFLTSFRESQLVVVGKGREKHVYPRFIARSPKLYVEEFENLWKHISNTLEAERTRRAIKAWRHGQRENMRI